MSNQGVFTFLSIESQLSASTTLAKGIHPAVTRVTITPSAYRQLELQGTRVGTARWYYNGTLVRQCSNSVIGRVDAVDQDGLEAYQVTIFDRRYAWANNQISGEYNVAKEGSVIPEREKTPQQLATLCLQAMEESSYDVSQLPNDDRPYIFWDIDNPAKELDALCSLYNCEISLQANDSVKIVRKGVGDYLPPPNYNTNVARQTYQKTLDPVEFPNKLAVTTSPTKWQVLLKLIPVGVEWFPELHGYGYKHIDELSYAPSGEEYTDEWGDTGTAPIGWWDAVDQPFDFLSGDERRLADEHVFRTYKVTIDEIKKKDSPSPKQKKQEENGEEVTGEVKQVNYLPDSLVELTDVKQILPLISELVETEGFGESKKPKEAFVIGRADDGYVAGFDEDEVERVRPPIETDPTTTALTVDDLTDDMVYRGDYQVDEEQGLVRFQEPVFLYYEAAEDGNGDKVAPEEGHVVYPELWLSCSINLKDPDTFAEQRIIRYVTVDPTSPAGTRFDPRDDIEPEYHRKTYKSDAEWQDNSKEVVEQTNFYIKQAAKQFVSYPAETATYMGFVEAELDGAIQQVSYTIARDGMAMTEVGRNVDTATDSVSLEEARRRLKLNEALRERARQKRTKKPNERQLARIMRRKGKGGNNG